MLLNSSSSLNSSNISFAVRFPHVDWYSGSERIYLDGLEFWSLHVSSVFCNLLHCWYHNLVSWYFLGWVFVNTESEKNPLCILSCSDPLILPSIDIFLLIVSQYISWSGYWCSSCSVSLWCLLNVSICTPIAASSFILICCCLGHHFVPNHPYLQCFTGEERDMTVFSSCYFCGCSFGTACVFLCWLHHWLLRLYHLEKKYSWYLIFSSLACKLQVFHLGRIWEILDSRRVVAVEVKVLVCLFSWIFVLSVSEESDSNSFACFLS